MTLYRSFGFFIQEDTIYVMDPNTNKIVMAKSAKDVEDKIEFGRSMIDQYISDCIGGQYRYDSWVRHNLTGKQYHDWCANNSKKA